MSSTSTGCLGRLLLAAKLHDDDYTANAYYASVCGIKLVELNKYEVHLLTLLDWKLVVSREEYDAYVSELEVLGHATRRISRGVRMIRERNSLPSKGAASNR